MADNENQALFSTLISPLLYSVAPDVLQEEMAAEFSRAIGVEAIIMIETEKSSFRPVILPPAYHDIFDYVVAGPLSSLEASAKAKPFLKNDLQVVCSSLIVKNIFIFPFIQPNQTRQYIIAINSSNDFDEKTQASFEMLCQILLLSNKFSELYHFNQGMLLTLKSLIEVEVFPIVVCRATGEVCLANLAFQSDFSKTRSTVGYFIEELLLDDTGEEGIWEQITKNQQAPLSLNKSGQSFRLAISHIKQIREKEDFFIIKFVPEQHGTFRSQVKKSSIASTSDLTAVLRRVSHGLTNLFNVDKGLSFLIKDAFQKVPISALLMYQYDEVNCQLCLEQIINQGMSFLHEVPKAIRLKKNDNWPANSKMEQLTRQADALILQQLNDQLNQKDEFRWVLLTIPLVSKLNFYGIIAIIGDANLVDLAEPANRDILLYLGHQIGSSLDNSRLLTNIVNAKREWETSFDAITDYLRIQDLEFNIKRCNKAFAGFFQDHPKDIVGNKCHRLIYGTDEICETCPVSRTIATGDQAYQEFTDKKRDCVIACYSFPVFSEYQKISSVIVYSRDISKEKNLHRQLIQSEKMASIGQLAAGIAHEINTPLSYVSSNLEVMNDYLSKILQVETAVAHMCEQLAQEENLPPAVEKIISPVFALKEKLKYHFILPDFEEAIKDSLEGISRVKIIVKDLKNFTHASEDVTESCDINEIIETTLSLVKNEIKYKMEVVKALHPVPKIHCYPIQISQVLLNLFINASQAVKEGGMLWVTTDCDGDHLIVSVRDNGKGIPDHVMTKIFDPFFTTKDVGVGTGLGLSVSYEIIKKHGGRITVESKVDEGTTFTIHLPVTS